jgi:hypothetical protein
VSTPIRFMHSGQKEVGDLVESFLFSGLEVAAGQYRESCVEALLRPYIGVGQRRGRRAPSDRRQGLEPVPGGRIADQPNPGGHVEGTDRETKERTPRPGNAGSRLRTKHVRHLARSLRQPNQTRRPLWRGRIEGSWW